jgi:uncharacterized protein (DUF1778 family)
MGAGSRTGRPPIGDTSATGRLSVRLTPAQQDELRRAAADNHTTASGVVRDAVAAYVHDYRADGRAFVRTKR